jgi:Nif-specific regulatory protein
MDPDRPKLPPAAELLAEAGEVLEGLRAARGAPEPPAPPPAAAPDERAIRELIALARQVTSTLDLRRLLDTVVQVFIAMTGAERGFVMLYNADGRLDFQTARDRDAQPLPERAFEVCGGAIREVAETTRSLFVDDILTRQEYGARDSVIALSLRSFTCVPLLHERTMLGLCYTDSRQPGRPLGPEDRALLEALAGHAALGIDNARRHGELLDAKSRLEAENESLRRQMRRSHRFENILGESAAMQRLFDLLTKVSATHAPVLVQGETGTGKELVARAIHFNGPRRDGPWQAVNCGSIPEALLNSELFGHRRGSFTGAVEDRRGVFEEAHGGTLFLDEVGEMPATVQVTLLRVLQEGVIKRVGETHERAVDVRIIAATNRDLAQEVHAKRFREDLFYRLNVVGIVVPPLRERGNDVVLLAETFTRRFAEQHRKRINGLAPEAVRWLLTQAWPGNVRELENCIERAVTLCENGVPLQADLLQAPIARQPPEGAARASTLSGVLEAVERDEVRKALAATPSRSEAARRLGITRQHLYNLIRKHGLQGPGASGDGVAGHGQ